MYIILDEISLELIRDEDGNVKMFDKEEDAKEYAENNINGMQVIEVS